MASNFLLVAPGGATLYEGRGRVTAAMSPRRMQGILAGAWRKLRGAALQQGQPGSPPETAAAARTRPRRSAKEELRAALAMLGRGLVIRGKLSRESPFGGAGFFASFGGGLTGHIRVQVDKDGVLAAVVEGSRGKLEVFRKGRRVVQRMTWTGSRDAKIGGVARELARLLDPRRLRRRLDDAAKVEPLDEREVAGHLCRGYAVTLDADLVEVDAGPGNPIGRLSVEEVEARFYLDKTSGALARMRFDIRQGLPPGVQVQVGGGGGGGDLEFLTRYLLTIEKVDPELAVRIPDEVRDALDR